MQEPIIIPCKVGMTREVLIRFQVIFTAFINGIALTPSDIDTCVLLGLKGEQLLRNYSDELVARTLFTSSGSARNTIAKLTDCKLIIKTGRSRKKVRISDAICTVADNSVTLDIQCIYDPSQS
jgi:hypothetical protein